MKKVVTLNRRKSAGFFAKLATAFGAVPNLFYVLWASHSFDGKKTVQSTFCKTNLINHKFVKLEK